MVKKKIVAKDKWKGKEWYQIVAPKSFQNAIIGETLSVDSSFINGRVVEASLIDLGGDPRKYYMKFFFKVDKIEGSKALTKLSGYDTTRDYIARIVNVRSSRIDTIDTVELKDAKMIVKSIAVSNRQVNTNIKRGLRKALKESVKAEISKLTLDEFIDQLVSDKLQKTVKKGINKIYPVRFFEIRKIKML